MKEEIEKLRQEFNERLNAILAKQQEKPPKIDPFLLRNPKPGEPYYSPDGEFVGQYIWQDSRADQGRWYAGRIRSSAEAVAAREKRDAAERRIIAAIHQANGGWWPDFNDRFQEKWFKVVGKKSARWSVVCIAASVPDTFLCSTEAKDKLGESLDQDFRIWMGIE